MYFSSDPRLMFLVTFMVLLISKSALGSDGQTDREATVDPHSAGGTSSSDYKVDNCTRASLNKMLQKTDRFSPVPLDETGPGFHSKKTPDSHPFVYLNNFGMNGYYAQCADPTRIPFVNGKFVIHTQTARSFFVYCNDNNPSWSVKNQIWPKPDDWSLDRGDEYAKTDILGPHLSEVQCIDAITAITDGKSVKFYNIPSMFTSVDFPMPPELGTGFGQSDIMNVRDDEKRDISQNHTVTVSAKLWSFDGTVVAPGKEIVMKFYAGPNSKSFQMEISVEVEEAPGYDYVPPPPAPESEFMGELIWIILILAILSAIMYGVYWMFKPADD
eukprot:66994_1